jgi:SAM-dependent methyltransferase
MLFFNKEASVLIDRSGKQLSCKLSAYDTYKFQHGDVLSVEPGVDTVQTPDSNLHVLTKKSLPIRIPPKMEFGAFRGYVLPSHLVLLTGAGIETLDPIGKAHIACYEKYMGLPEGCSILEIGCGIGRDAFQLIGRTPAIGKYIGIDVTRDSIVWCQNNITPKYRNFTFHHFDAKHELYNPLGSKSSMDFRLPARAASIDRIFLGSVFTHLFEDEVTHYMREIGRVLKKDGLAYATFFLYSPEIIEAARRTKRSHNNLLFEHEYGDGCYVSDPNYPTGSVAFTDEAMQRMMQNGGVKPARPYLPGWWSGYFDDPAEGQDVAILTPV